MTAPPRKSRIHPTDASPRLPRITVTMPNDLYEELLDACGRDDLPIVYWVRQAIRAKLEAAK